MKISLPNVCILIKIDGTGWYKNRLSLGALLALLCEKTKETDGGRSIGIPTACGAHSRPCTDDPSCSVILK